MKTCENCGIAFEPAKPWQRFHSPACKLRAFRAAEAAQSPTRPVEQALQDALAAVRAKGSDPAAVVAELRGRLDALYPPPAPVRPEPEPEPVKATKGRAAKGKATKPKPEPRFKVSREPVKVSREPVQSADAKLLARFYAARSAGHSQGSIGKAIGFRDGTTLSHWINGKRPLSDEKAAALAAWLTSQGH